MRFIKGSYFLIMLLLFSTISYAQEEDAGITPDSPLWGLDRALERIELLLANGDVEGAKIQLKHAHERLLEVKIMIEQNKLEQAEKAKDAHREKIEDIKVKIRGIDSDDEDAVEIEVELENEIEDQEDEIEDVERELEIKIKGQITPEQQAAIDALIESFKDSTNEMRIEIKIKRDEIKVKIKERTGKSDDEVEDEFEEHQNRTINRERAEEQIKDAEEELLDAKEDAREELGENTGNWSASINSLFREAEIKLTNARAAFNEGKYGEAYGQANAAENIARNIERILDNLEEREERNGTRDEDDDEEDEDTTTSITGQGSRGWADRDGDGYYGLGECAPAYNCVNIGGTINPDCNDKDAKINPRATEICGNQVDENCNGIAERCNVDSCVESEMKEIEGIEANIVKDRIIIYYEDIRLKDELMDLVSYYGLEVAGGGDVVPFIVVKVSEDRAFEFICKLKKDSRIKDVDFDFLTSGS